ncbi:MAG: class I SAM-dependent methyltransferase [bacterium]|nr:class I SAM-dependent methyltransferase [bacterium]
MLISRQTCRSCGSTALTPVLSLGDQVLAGNFGFAENLSAVTRRVPLDLVRCDSERDEDACGLVQLRHTVPGDLMYSSYGYRSGINQTMRDHLSLLAHELEQRVHLTEGDVVIDIGANDGTLLRAYATPQFSGVGFEPSIVQPEALPAHIQFIKNYFTASNFEKRYPSQKAKIITSIAMFYDLEDPNAFVSDVACLLREDGIWVLEVAYLPKTLTKNSFDTICHEHLEYYSFSSIEHLLRRHGLTIIDVGENGINGGTIRVYATHANGRMSERTEEAQNRIYTMQREEFDMELDSSAPYIAFAENVEKIKTDLPFMLRELCRAGKKIYGYGASTKGNVILQYCEIGTDLVTAIADRNPAKWGQKSPGMNIPIISEDEMRAAMPDYLLVLPWFFLDEFMKRESAFVERGGKFIIPIPEVSYKPYFNFYG